MEERRFQKPVNEGDVVEVTIEGTGAKGDGIAKVNNFVIIVPGVREGDRVKVRITRVLKKMAFAEVVKEGEEATASEESVAAEEGEEEAEVEESYSEEE